jgi:hypothetical protein
MRTVRDPGHPVQSPLPQALRFVDHRLTNFYALLALLLTAAAPAGAGVSVTTYHIDAARSGWNYRETALTPAAVGGGRFQLLTTVTLDGQVDAEPLYVAGQSISGQGVHDTVYVATENNSVYAIDATSGTVLLQKSLGTPLPVYAIPGGCPNDTDAVGINSTPVIDLPNQALYVVTLTYSNQTPSFWMRELDLATLNDKVPPVQIQASARLTNGQTFNFNAATLRQRAALLLKSNTVYAAFASFCDNLPSVTRGWVLGWQAGTLNPLPGKTTNKLASSPNYYFLSSVWMSGYGLAADGIGTVYFVTGNTDPANTTYYPANLAESVVKLRWNLTTVLSYFTPGTASTGRASLDSSDNDFGAGGVMLLPPQPGTMPRLAVAAGKVGTMYLMNRDSLGGYADGADDVLQAVDIGQCFCGASYYKGADGVGRVVSSGGEQVMVWKVVTSSSAPPQLALESTSAPLATGQDAGFFTSVTSHGAIPGSQVIWAVSRPANPNPQAVQLYAFDPSQISNGTSKTLFTAAAGSWPNGNGNANIVPTVANGHVYVASYKQLAIFGLAASGAKPGPAATPAMAAEEEINSVLPGHAVYGKLIRVENATLVLQTRNGNLLTIDPTPARRAETSALPVIGRAYLARGEYDAAGVLHATSVQRVKGESELWKPDR